MSAVGVSGFQWLVGNRWQAMACAMSVALGCKCNLVPQFIIVLIAPPIEFKLMILCNYTLVRISNISLDFARLFYFGP